MYDTRFAFAPPIDIDCNVLTDIYINEIPHDVIPVYRYNISCSLYLTNIAKQYLWLSDTIDFFVVVAGGFIPIHRDSEVDDDYRAAVLNMPVLRTEKTYTSWYEMPAGTEWRNPWLEPGKKGAVYQGGKGGWFPKLNNRSIAGDPIILFSTTTFEPIIINPQLPHSVKNNGFNRRVVASWHTKFKNYDQAKTFFSIT